MVRYYDDMGKEVSAYVAELEAKVKMHEAKELKALKQTAKTKNKK